MTTERRRKANHREWSKLIGAVLDGTATDLEHGRLEDLLRNDADARLYYRRYVNVHVALRAYGRGAGQKFPSTRSHAGWRRVVFLVGIATAAAVLLAAIVSWPRLRESPLPSVASVTRVVSARWLEASNAVAEGDRLLPGTLDLAQGFAEITFDGGAAVVMEAPVRLELVDSRRVILHAGKVVTRAIGAATGFVVETPGVTLTDLGTEFGVQIGPAGDTQLQVFEGSVEAEWKTEAGEPSGRQRLTAGQAVILGSPEDVGPHAVAFTPERFVRTLPIPDRHASPGGPLYNRGRFQVVHVVPAPAHMVIDGDLADWDRSGSFRSACAAPYSDHYYLEGAMMYDREKLYIGAHVGDPAPMCSKRDASEVGTESWRGGSVIVRVATDADLGWPLRGQGRALANRNNPLVGRRPEDVTDHIVHMILWYSSSTGRPRLHLDYGMDMHGSCDDPPGWEGKFRRDADGLGYTLEYAIPWSLLHARSGPPHAGEVRGASWTVHWSDRDGRFSHGHLVEITNHAEPVYQFLNAATWGQALFHGSGNLPPEKVAPGR